MAYLDELNQIWQMVKDSFRPELTDTITDLFLGGLQVTGLEDTVLVMSADSMIKIRTVNAKYKPEMEKRFSDIFGYDVTIRFTCTPQEQTPGFVTGRGLGGGQTLTAGPFSGRPAGTDIRPDAATETAQDEKTGNRGPQTPYVPRNGFAAGSSTERTDGPPEASLRPLDSSGTPYREDTEDAANVRQDVSQDVSRNGSRNGNQVDNRDGSQDGRQNGRQEGRRDAGRGVLPPPPGVPDGEIAPGEIPEDTAGTPTGTTSGVPIGSTMPPFNFEYTFENFIVGSSNKFAHAACLAVADHPAQSGNTSSPDNPLFTYNPLFIYGPSGLGKTHLLYAITNKLRQKNNKIKVIYIKGEDFTNQMIDSLARQAMKEFRDKYRSCDVLLIDDIQFIAGKTSTQEEFFHTFNALYEDSKQIILTSDRPPREIKTLEDRLKTRFEWGLIADIQPPDLELRTAIIKKKADQVNVSIPDDVLSFLAENLRSNIRQIEGAIKKLGAMSFLSGNRITMEVARSCISELLGGEEPVTVTVDKIFTAVYKKYNIKREDIVSTRRTKDIAAARHVAVYLVRQITDMSLPNIGKIFGRDHSTILSSIDTVEKRMAQDGVFRAEIEEMSKEIRGL
jgi:chromosomal replication initiator protein